jgi:hypothetical protein
LSFIMVTSEIFSGTGLFRNGRNAKDRGDNRASYPGDTALLDPVFPASFLHVSAVLQPLLHGTLGRAEEREGSQSTICRAPGAFRMLK